MYTVKSECRKNGLISHDRAVSEVVGTVLLLTIVVAGTTIFLLAGTQIISQAQSSAAVNSAEQAFTMADSRLSKARYSTAIFQQAPIEISEGYVVVNGTWDDSHIIVYNVDGHTEIYNYTLGTIRCIMDQGEVAYQDGGVWFKSSTGGSVMLSPPDFDYNGVTLTLPVMNINGNSTMSTAGNTKVLISVNSTDPKTIYPLPGVGGNPIPQGHAINITIKSDYYDAWASYINERTRASATTNPSKKIVNISLDTGVPVQSGLVTGGWTTRSMDVPSDLEAPIETFQMHLVNRNTGNDPECTFGVTPPGGGPAIPNLQFAVLKTNGNQPYRILQIKYTDGAAVTESFSTWVYYDRKDPNTPYLDLNLLNHSIMMTYDGTSTDPSITWGDNVNANDVSAKFWDEMDDTSNAEVTIGDEKTLHDVTEHYMRLMAEYDQAHGGALGGPQYGNVGNFKWKADESTFQLSYYSSQDIKYLYLTQGILNTGLQSSG